MDLSVKLLQFHYFFKAFVAYVLGNATDLMISPDQATGLQDDFKDWDKKFTTYTTPDDHNTASISDINAAYEDYAPKAETVRVQVRDNTAIILSGQDKVNLDIQTLDKTRSKVLPPNFAPSIVFVSMKDLQLTIFAMDPSHLGKKAKPPGAKFIGSQVAYTAADAAQPAPEAFSTRAPEGKTIFPILYSSDKVGTRIWVKCWYMSPTGKPGPVSIVFTIVLA